MHPLDFVEIFVSLVCRNLNLASSELRTMSKVEWIYPIKNKFPYLLVQYSMRVSVALYKYQQLPLLFSSSSSTRQKSG